MPIGVYPRKKTQGFQRGYTPWNKGRPVEEIVRKKISENHSRHTLGKHLSEETKKKLSISLKGRISWNKGKKLSEEHRKKLSLARIGKYCGENSPSWKGGISFLLYTTD